jgi:pimeloyl-ACP methyl ester carboxylesterase
VTVHIERGGDSGNDAGPTVLLLHGSGATGAVWAPVVGELSGLRWITVDLPGHGRSEWLPSYHHRDYAAAVGKALGTAEIDLVVGHSLGALVALTLADGTHGLRVGGVLAIAMKVSWTPEELARRAALANRPQQNARSASSATKTSNDPRLTADPPATQEELAAVMDRVRVPVRLACGDADPGIEPADMAAVLGRDVEVIAGAGHNPHIDDPARIAALITTAARG